MKTYAQLLKDPRWQKKRLEILERDEFSCQDCGDTESTLHVHHCYYETGKMPWEYPERSLVTLCESCHEDEKDVMAEKIALTNALSMCGYRKTHFNSLACDIHYSAFHSYLSRQSPELSSWILSTTILVPELYEAMESAFYKYTEKSKQKVKEDKNGKS